MSEDLNLTKEDFDLIKELIDQSIHDAILTQKICSKIDIPTDDGMLSDIAKMSFDHNYKIRKVMSENYPNIDDDASDKAQYHLDLRTLVTKTIKEIISCTKYYREECDLDLTSELLAFYEIYNVLSDPDEDFTIEDIVRFINTYSGKKVVKIID